MSKAFEGCKYCGRTSLVYSRHGNIQSCRCLIDEWEFNQQRMEEHEFPKDMPLLFRDTVRERLDPGLQPVLDWSPTTDYMSILLHGVTGTGKTRAAWTLLHRLLTVYRTTYRALTMREFEMLVETGFSKSNHAQELDRLCRVPILFFDDLGKERLTARLESDLFAVLDARYAWQRITIITTNFVGSKLAERFNEPETAAALLRRLRTAYDIYPKPKQP